MGISKRLLALLAGGSAVGVGAPGAAVSSGDVTAPEPVEVGGDGTALDIEGDQIQVDAQASPLDDLLDSASVGGLETASPDSPPSPSLDSPSPSPDSPPSPSPDSPSPSPDSPESADS
ncbi:MAG: hypothetical protein ACRDHJ_11210 [Actinomycetota bacterium]